MLWQDELTQVLTRTLIPSLSTLHFQCHHFLQQSQAKRSHTFLLCIALISTLLAIKKERSRFAYFIRTIFYKCLISPSHLLRNYGKSSHTRCISYSQVIISYAYIFFLSLLAKSAQSPFLCFPLFNLLNILLNDIFH